jgi:hypothetical protein
VESAPEPDGAASPGDKAAPPRQSAMERLKQADPSPAADGSSKQAAAPGAAGTAQPPARQSVLDRLETGPATAAPGKGAGRRAATTAQQRQSAAPTKAAATAITLDRCFAALCPSKTLIKVEVLVSGSMDWTPAMQEHLLALHQHPFN